MKSLILFFILFFSMRVSFAQERKNVIKINPINIFGSVLTVCYERVLGPARSGQIQLDYLPFSNGLIDSTQGFRLTAEHRWYIDTKRYDMPRGAYLAPFFSVGAFKNSKESTATFIGMGGIFGMQALVHGGFSLDFFLGPAIAVGGFGDLPFIYPRAGFTMGVAF